MTATPRYSSVHDLDPLREQYKTCWFKSYYEDGRPRPCRSPRCPCSACRRKGAEKESAILIRSFRQKPPDFTFTLGLSDGGHTNDVKMAAYLKAFCQRVRDLRKSMKIDMEYDIRLEFKAGEPHGHLTIITSLDWSVFKMKKLIRGWWAASCQHRTVAVYCDRVADHVRHARYVTKDVRDRSGVELPPEGWNGRRCRLTWRSRNFLIKSKKLLWKEQCDEWFPKKTGQGVKAKTTTGTTSSTPSEEKENAEADSTKSDFSTRLAQVMIRQIRAGRLLREGVADDMFYADTTAYFDSS